MIQTYAGSDATTDNNLNYSYYLKFINCKNNPATIKLDQQNNIAQQSIYVFNLPKPNNFPQFKGWKIINPDNSGDYQILSDKDIIYTNDQDLVIGCMINDYSRRYDKILYATPVIEPGVSFNISWGEF